MPFSHSCCLLLVVLVFFASCAARKPSSAEGDLFPAASQTTWWVVLFSGSDETGMGVQLSSLLAIQAVGEGIVQQGVYSVWQEAGQQFMQRSLSPSGGAAIDRSFPLRLGDTAAAATWEFVFDRNGLHLSASGAQGDTRFRAKWPLNASVAPVIISDLPAMAVVPPLLARCRASFVPQALTGKICAITLRDSDFLLQSPEPVMLLSLNLADSSSVVVLATVDAAGSSTLAIAGWDARGKPVAATTMDCIPETPWQRLASGKQYPLTMRVRINDQPFLLLPAALEQEAGTGRQALWMGAVYLADPATNAITGSGNMLIFNH